MQNTILQQWSCQSGHGQLDLKFKYLYVTQTNFRWICNNLPHFIKIIFFQIVTQPPFLLYRTLATAAVCLTYLETSNILSLNDRQQNNKYFKQRQQFNIDNSCFSINKSMCHKSQLLKTTAKYYNNRPIIIKRANHNTKQFWETLQKISITWQQRD